MSEMPIALRMEQVSKQFPGTLAVDNVDLEVRAGEVHALMGENGAGKSTLMKMLAGSFNDYTGEIIIYDKPAKLYSPADAKKCGVEMVYQELSVAHNRSVQENLFAAELPGKGMFLDEKKLKEMALESLAKVKLEKKIDPMALMKNVSQHESQLIEIAKVLNNNPRILVMDEPTSSLSSAEVEIMFNLIREIKQQGIAIIYISHHLAEVFEIADRVTVMRDGKKIGTHNVSDVTKEQLVEMMIGQKMTEFCKDTEHCCDDVVMKVEDLTHYGFIHNISFDLHRGEILGVVGLAGSGRSELGRCLCGADAVDYGKIYLEGKEIKLGKMSRMLNHGIAYLTEDRKLEGLALRLTNKDNIMSTIIPGLSKAGFFLPKKGKPIVEELFKRLYIVPNNPNLNTGNLSGGNQQKVLLAKWLSTKPKILILDEPTRGVDVGAKKLIHETIVQLTKEGISVLLLSSDLPEVVSLSDRVIVLKSGHLIGELHKDECIDENKALLAANGERSVFSIEYNDQQAI